MKTNKTVIWLGCLIVLLTLIAAGTGLFYEDPGSSFAFTTVRGETREIYGHGLYRYDTPLGVVQNRAGDAYILVLGVPLLAVSLWLYRRGSVRGGIVLTAALAYFLYIYGSLAIGAAYNNLFIVYVVLFSASLFGLILALGSFDFATLPDRFSSRVPRRGTIIFLIATGISLLIVWLGLSLIPALLAGQAPYEVGSYTTFITAVVDLGVVVPVVFITARLMARRAALGYLLGPVTVIFSMVLGAGLIVSGIAQLLTAVMGVGQFIGFTLPFAILTLAAAWLTILLLRSLSAPDSARGQISAAQSGVQPSTI